jgi:mono/diheme cytochrome c family protein
VRIKPTLDGTYSCETAIPPQDDPSSGDTPFEKGNHLKTPWKFVVAAAAVFVALQCVRPTIPASPATAEIQVPQHIHRILEKNCYSCHSSERKLAWFDEIQPGYWLVRKDILTAREHLNFSTLGSKPAAAQKAALYEAVNMIQLGAMPLPRFTALHPEARVSPEELAALKAYLSPWAPLQASPTSANGSPSQAISAPVPLERVRPEWNGVAFDPSFENWKPLSFTDRGDNNTFRFVLGNDIAIQAAESGHISPWPDGTRFAKIAWQQQIGNDGLVHPGQFVQVELMVKDSGKYASTDGWGWGRWHGSDLKPYGSDARFVNECTGCHQPVKGNDYVYTLPMTSARGTLQEVVNNRAATLPAGLPYQPLRWTPITMFVDRKTHTMATLYGNQAAVKSLDLRNNSSVPPRYGQGAVLALVTWVQRDDPHWFGGRIPDSPTSVEFVTVGQQNTSSYRSFDGPNLTETHPSATSIERRNSFLLGLRPVSLP